MISETGDFFIRCENQFGNNRFPFLAIGADAGLILVTHIFDSTNVDSNNASCDAMRTVGVFEAARQLADS